MSENSFVRLARYAPDAGFDIMGGDVVVQCRISLIDRIVGVDSYYSDEGRWATMCTLPFDQYQWEQIEAIDSISVDVEM